MARFLESYLPWILGFVGVFVYFSLSLELLIVSKFGQLLESSITISSIAVGFLAASKSILISLDHKEIIQKLKRVGQYSRLIDFFITATYCCFVLTIYSSVLLLVEFKNVSIRNNCLIAFWIFLAVSSAFSCLRIINLFSKILRKTSEN